MSFLTRAYKFEQNADSTGVTDGSVPASEIHKSQRAMALRSFKKLLKPLLRVIKKKQLLRKTLAEIQQQNAYNSSLEDMRRDPAAQEAHDDNLANEALVERLHAEIDGCAEGAAIIARHADVPHVLPVLRGQTFIPVHFARTSNGTFFWTSMQAEVARQNELELMRRSQLDRWGQA